MRAIKIDITKKDIYEVEIKGNLNHALYELLDCDTITGVRLSATEYMYVDDNGLWRQPLLGAFRINGYPQALPGHGIIVGLAGPQEISTKLDVDFVKANVRFVDVSELPAPVMTQYFFERPEDFKRFMEDSGSFRTKHSEN